MTVLTWRDVAAPDFNGVQDGFRNASDMLNRGFDAAKKGITAFDQAKTDRVNAGVLAQIAGATDENAANAILANLASNPNVGRISADTFKTAMSRPTDLLNQAVTAEQLAGQKDTDKYNAFVHGQAITDTNARVAARPLVSKLLQAGVMQKGETDSSGAAARINTILSDPTNAGLVAALPAEDQAALRTNPLEYSSKLIGNDQAALNVQTGRYDLQSKKDAAALQKETAQLYATVAGVAGDANEARAMIMSSKASPEAKAAALNQLSGAYPGLVGTPQLGDTGASTNAGDAYNAVVGNGAYGPPPPKPLTSMPISGVIDYGKTVLIPGTRAKGVGVDPASGRVLGSSATGIYQITSSTLQQYAPKALGPDWQNQAYTPENQDKIAHAIYDDNHSPEALMKQWASLSRADAERASKGGWNVARQIIAKGETGGVPAGNTFGANEVASAETDVAARQGQIGAQSVAEDYFKAGNDTTDVGTVADQLRTSGPFKGTSPRYLIDHLVQIMDRTHGTAAQAAVILKRSLTAGHEGPDQGGLNLLPRALDWIHGTPNLPGGRKLDSNKVDQFIGEVTSPDALKNVENLNRLGRGAASLATVKANRDAIAQRLLTVQQAYNNGDRRLGHQVLMLQQQLADADAQVKAVLDSKRSSPDNGYQPLHQVNPANAPSAWDRAMKFIGF